MSNSASALIGIHGEQVALSDVSVSAVLRDLLAEVTVSQTYRNDERVNIEAIYTFPLPLDAVLLDLQVEIGGRVLKGVVVEKTAAEERYEDAVAAGDAAVMLELLEPGLYTLNVGNLLAGEVATITCCYTLLYRWAGDHLRFFLPTTVAPRYGASPHRPHQTPEASLTVENRFSLQVELFGTLRDAQFVCPSHVVGIDRCDDKAVISLQQEKVAMDRDFILSVKAPPATRSFALCGADGEGVAAVASFQPFFPGLRQPRPLNLAIVIDCSGSMQGDSIKQAKQALQGILDILQPHDRVTLIAFGSHTNIFSDHLLPCNKTNLDKARRFAKQLEADLGGTEIALALQTAYAAVRRSESADIFLITDGEVSSWQQVVEEARSAGHRVFTVGVGSAVSEAFVRGLAAETGGGCELVSPHEGMADRVIRHFERMRAPRASRVTISWPEGAHDVAPSQLGAIFEGDTVVAFAQFDRSSIDGNVVLEVETEAGDVMRQELPLVITPSAETADHFSTVARLAASARMQEQDDRSGLETALHYRLVSPWTHYLMIAERPENEKAQNMPELRKVPQTMAAGWGGVGSVVASMSIDFDLAARSVSQSFGLTGVYDAVAVDRFDDSVEYQTPDFSLPDEFRRLLQLIESEPGRLDIHGALGLLHEAGLAEDFSQLLGYANHLGLNAECIAVVILAGLLDGVMLECLSDETQPAVRSLQQQARQVLELMGEMERQASNLADIVRHSESAKVLQRDPARAAMEVLEKFMRFREVHEQLQEHVREQTSRIDQQEQKRQSSIPRWLARARN